MLGTRDGSIDELPVEHAQIVLGDDEIDDRIFGTLRFVNGHGIRKRNIAQFLKLIEDIDIRIVYQQVLLCFIDIDELSECFICKDRLS